jgi:drug/metabolite transporter (DMT)-like permease
MLDVKSRSALPTAAVILVAGLVGISHGSIFARVAEADAIVIAAYRLGLAALVLLPFALWSRLDEMRRLTPRQWGLGCGAGVFLALHFGTWIASLDHTSISNSVVLVTLNPVWIALFTALVTRRLPRGLLAASIVLAVTGAAIIGMGSAGSDTGSLYGDALALVGGMSMAGYLLLATRVRQDVSLLTLATVAFGVGALCLWIVVLALGLPFTGLSVTTYQALIAMALAAQLLGHGSINWALKHFNPAFVAVCMLGEPILASLLAYLYFGEAIAAATYVGGTCILMGIYLGGRAERGYFPKINVSRS